ncbi:hypothetical protein SSTU70S_05720 [Stutzerimonas stutzeri]
MTSHIGRPRIPGEYITVQLNQTCSEIVEEGAAHGLNRSAWVRALIEYVFGRAEDGNAAYGREPLSAVQEAMDAEAFAHGWPASWFKQPTPHKATMKLDVHHRVLLRQFECYVQSLDWLREFGRNDAVLLLIAAHGPVFNRHLARKQK